MRSFSVALVCLAVGLATASPLASPFDRVIGNSYEQHPDVVSTTLSLGRDWDAVATANSYSRSHEALAQPVLFGYPLRPDEAKAALSPSYIKPLQPLPHPYRQESSQVASNLGASTSNIIAHSSSPNRRISPELDFHFPKILIEEVTGRMDLPSTVIHIRSPWLSEVYDRLVVSLPLTRAFDHSELHVPIEVVERLAFKTREMIAGRGDMYKLQLPAQWLAALGATEPMEVLIRYHEHLGWPKAKVHAVVSIWSTADHGSKLALLGVFRMTKYAFNTLISSYPEVRRFSVYRSWNMHLTLFPRSLQVEPPQMTKLGA